MPTQAQAGDAPSFLPYDLETREVMPPGPTPTECLSSPIGMKATIMWIPITSSGEKSSIIAHHLVLHHFLRILHVFSRGIGVVQTTKTNVTRIQKPCFATVCSDTRDDKS